MLKEINDIPRTRGGKEENLKQLSRDRAMWPGYARVARNGRRVGLRMEVKGTGEVGTGRLETRRKITLNGKKCAERPQRLRLYTASRRIPASSLSFSLFLFRFLFYFLFLSHTSVFYRPVSAQRGECRFVPVGNFSVLSLTHRNPSTAIPLAPVMSHRPLL